MGLLVRNNGTCRNLARPAAASFEARPNVVSSPGLLLPGRIDGFSFSGRRRFSSWPRPFLWLIERLSFGGRSISRRACFEGADAAPVLLRETRLAVRRLELRHAAQQREVLRRAPEA